MHTRSLIKQTLLACLICLGLLPVAASAEQHTLTITVQNGQYAEAGTIAPSSGSHSINSGEVVTLSAVAQAGYTYHWECAGAPTVHNQTGSVNLTMDKSYTVKLVFEPASYSLTVDSPVEGGTAAVQAPVPSDMSNIPASTLVTVKATPSAGYSFIRWTTVPSDEPLSPSASSAEASVYISRDVKLTPVFAQATYLLDVLDSPANIGGETTGGGYYISGATVNVTATPNAGFVFDGWTVTAGTVTIASPGSTSTAVTLGSGAGPWKITANFKVADPQATTLIVMSDVGGTVEAKPNAPPHVSPTNVGSGGSAMINVTSGKTVSLKASPIDSNKYDFSGWVGPVNSSSVKSTSVVVTEATTVRAKFKPKAYNFTAEAELVGGGWAGGNKMEATGTGEDGSTITAISGGWNSRAMQYGTTVTLKATPAPGYAFVKWEVASESKLSSADKAALAAAGASTGVVTATVTMPSKATKVTAKFQKIPSTYTLTLNKSTGGGATASGTFTNPFTSVTSTVNVVANGSGNYQEDTNVTIKAVPEANYKFHQWTGDNVASMSSGTTTVKMTSAKTVTATFQRTHSNLTVNILPAGAATAGAKVKNNATNADVTGSTTQLIDSTLSLKPVGATGSGVTWVFDHWEGDLTGSADPGSISMSTDRTLTAVFVARYTLTLDCSIAEGGNGYSVSAGTLVWESTNKWTAVYPAGTVVTITVLPGGDNAFVNWTGDTSGVTGTALTTNPITVTMNSARTITANLSAGSRVKVTAVRDKGCTTAWHPSQSEADAIRVIGNFTLSGRVYSYLTPYGVAPDKISEGAIAKGATVQLTAPQYITDTVSGVQWEFVRWVKAWSANEAEIWDAPVISTSPNCSYTLPSEGGSGVSAVYTDKRTLAATVKLDGASTTAIQVQVNSALLTTGGTEDVTYNVPASLNAATASATNYVFSGWSNVDGGSTDAATATATLTSDKTVTAQYKTRHYLSVGLLTNPTGGEGALDAGALISVTNATTGKTLALGSNPTVFAVGRGENVTLVAQSAVTAGTTKYRFAGWDTNSDGIADNTATTYTVSSISGDATVKAVYIRLQTLTISVAPVDAGTTSPSAGVYEHTYDYNSNVNLNADASAGKAFDKWTTTTGAVFAGGATSSVNSITMNGDHSIVANFKVASNALNVRILVNGVTPNPLPSGLSVNADGTTLTHGQSKDYNYGTFANITAATPAGYNFIEWQSADKPVSPGGSNPAGTIEILGPQTVTASYRALHNVTLTKEVRPSGAGGTPVALEYESVSGNVYTYAHNNTATLEANKAAGFKFVGWEIDTNNDGIADITSTEETYNITVTSALGVKAIYALEYQLTLAASPAGTGSVATSPSSTNPSTRYHGEEVSIVATANSGYNFANWTSSPGSTFANAGAASTKITIGGNTTATANFSAGGAGLTAYVEVDGGSPKPGTFTDLSITADGTTLYSTQTKAYSFNDTVNVTASTASGYKFLGWSGSLTDATNPGSFTMNALAKSITARYSSLHTVTLLTETRPSGTGGSPIVSTNYENVSGNVYTYVNGSTVTLSANASAGYRFLGWDVGNDGSIDSTSVSHSFQIAASTTIKAVYAKEYTITFERAPSGGGTINKASSYTAYHGEIITNIVATPSLYWNFSKWTSPDPAVNNTTANPIVAYTVTGPQTITANFTATGEALINITINIKLDDSTNPACPLTVAAGGSTVPGEGSASVLSGGQSKQYYIGDTAGLSAAIVSGYDFIRWEDTSSTNPVRTEPVSTSKTLTAIYKTRVTLTMAINPLGLGTTVPSVGSHTTSDDGILYKGETVYINAEPYPANIDTYAFTGWTVSNGAGPANPSVESTSLVLDAATKTVTANYVSGHKLEVRVKYENTTSTDAPKTFAVAHGTRKTLANGAGNVAGIYMSDPNAMDYSVRTMVIGENANIRAIPAAPGYVFKGWTASETSDVPDVGLTSPNMTVLMDAPKVYTAIFEKVRVSLEVYTIPAGVAGVRGEALNCKLASGPEPRVYEVFYGTKPSLKATSETTDYGFVAWFKGRGYSSNPANRYSEQAEVVYSEPLTDAVTQVTAYFLPYGLHRMILFVDPENDVDIEHVKVPGAVNQTYTIVDGHPACVADVGINDPYSEVKIWADPSPTGLTNDTPGSGLGFLRWEPGFGETNEVISWLEAIYENDTKLNYPITRAEVRLTAVYTKGEAYRLRLKWDLIDGSAEIDEKYKDDFKNVSLLDDWLGNIYGNTIYFGYPLLLVNRQVEIKDGIFPGGHIETFTADARFPDGPFVLSHWTDEQPDGTVVNDTAPGAGVMTFKSAPGIIGKPQTVTAYVDLLWYNIGLKAPVLQQPAGWSATTITGSGMFSWLSYDDTEYPSDVFKARERTGADKNPAYVAHWQRVKGGSAPVLHAAGTPSGYRFLGWDINDDGSADFADTNFTFKTWPSAWPTKMTADRTVTPVYIRQFDLTLSMNAVKPDTEDKVVMKAPSTNPGGIALDKGNLSETKTYDYNTTYTITATPQEHHVLVKWIIEKATADGGLVYDSTVENPATPGDSAPLSITVTLDYPTKVTAVFAKEQFDLTVNVAPSISDSDTHGLVKLDGMPVSGTTSITEKRDYGTNPAILAIPDAGYAFKYWTVTPDSLALPEFKAHASTSVQVDGTKTVTAHFERLVSLTMAVDPSTLPYTIVTPNVYEGGAPRTYTELAGERLTDGSVVTIQSGTDSGYDFVGWTIVDGNGPRTETTPTTTLTLYGDTTATANYAKLFDVTIKAPASITENATITASPAPISGGPMTSSAGGMDATGKYRENTSVTFSATCTHFEVDHWIVTIDGVPQPGPYPTGSTLTLTVTGELSVEAVFKPKNYTITVEPYSANSLTPIATSLDGTCSAVSPGTHNFLPKGANSTWTLPYGASVTLSTTAADHYGFNKWTDTSHSTVHGTELLHTFTVRGNQTIHAEFVRSEYLLTTSVDPSGAGVISNDGNPRANPATTTHSAGSNVTLVAAASSADTDFEKWTGDTLSASISGATITLPMNQDRSVGAEFVNIVRLKVANPNPAYGTITVSGQRRTETDGGETIYVFKVGTQATITATPASGHHQFDSWTFSPSTPAGVVPGNATNSFTMEASPKVITATANFSPKAYSLTVQARATGGQAAPYDGAPVATSLTGVGAFPDAPVVTNNFLTTPTVSARFDAGVQLATTAAPYYRFVRWTDSTGVANLGTNPDVFPYTMLGGNQTVIALFERSVYKLTAHVDPVGGGTIARSPAGTADPHPTSPDPDTQVYAPNTSVTLTANDTTTGKIFTGWSGDAAGMESRSITYVLTRDYEVTANFANARTLTVPKAEHGTVTVSGYSPYVAVVENPDGSKTYTFVENATATLTATPESEHYYLDHWTFSPDISGSVSPNPGTNPAPERISFPVTQDVTATPFFQAKTYTLTVTPIPAAGAASLVAHQLGNPDHDFIVTSTMSRLYSTDVTLETSPKDNPGERYRFDSWKEGYTTLGSGTTLPFEFDRTTEITANYVRQVLVKVNAPVDVTPANSAPPATPGNVTPGEGVYRYDVRTTPQSVTITAVASTGFKFVDWGAGFDDTIAASKTVNTTDTASTATITFNITDALANLGDIELTPRFERRLYTVNIERWERGMGMAGLGGLLGHSPGADVGTNQYYYGTVITANMSQVYSTYRFVGWGWGADTTASRVVQQNATGSMPETYSYTVTADQTISAIFTKVCVINLTSDPADGSQGTATITSPLTGRPVGGSPTKTEFDYGTIVFVQATPETGATFLGWAGAVADADAPSTYIELKSDQAVIARFKLAVYRNLTVSTTPSTGGTVTINGNPVDSAGVGTANPVSYTKQINDGDTAQLTATAAPGYAFAGWEPASAVTINNPAVPSTGVLMNADKTVAAKFTPRNYALQVLALPSAGGSVSGGGSYAYSATASVSATANPGYYFSGWDTDGNGSIDVPAGSPTATSGSATITITTDQTAYAIFRPISQAGSITIAVYEDVDGTYVLNSAAASTDVSAPDEFGDVTLTARPAAGYQAIGWGGPDVGAGGTYVDDPVTNTYTMVVPADQDRHIHFYVGRDNVKLTWSALPTDGGSVEFVPAGGSYPAGTTVRVIAKPESGKSFIEWTGDLSGSSADTTITLTENSHVVANFETVRTWQVTMTFDTASACHSSGEDKLILDGTPIAYGDMPGLITKFYGHRARVLASYSLKDIGNYAFEGWTNVSASAIQPTVLPNYSIYVESNLDIRGLIQPINPMLETKIRMLNLDDDFQGKDKTNVISIGGSISLGGVVTMGQVCTIRVVLEDDYMIDHWAQPAGSSVLSATETTGVDAESGKRWVERTLTVRDKVTYVEVFLAQGVDPYAGTRRNIVDGGKNLLDDVPATRSSGHLIDGQRE
ncbi:putative repeat protein (TIGR02543 family) [Ereboglobus sp. PH5-10]|uniref:InlB B-repeat-containing protein n=1 Tax=Ereboglobus sp. PH5-10 TaxID=2940629 RepID=UPI002406E684|nr:InlB B-repeat-containing protein [Ereboglobus sp. PH5-10]MDF9828335.1 putative repeat protein (TIGR02543 family) [Ereboglobus sp. PH5-10]